MCAGEELVVHPMAVMLMDVLTTCLMLTNSVPFSDRIGDLQLKFAGVMHVLFTYVEGLNAPRAMMPPMAIASIIIAHP